ncbi:MAG: DNA adenine methylase [Alphaproteobacteria bacterium]|nr:DNA adenine methylase [Alphaproteobacteria bacterium]
MLKDLRTRLSGVVIECLPRADVITRHDRPATLFYLDPPYWENETDYGAGLFSRDDFERLESALGGLSGAFIMSRKVQAMMQGGASRRPTDLGRLLATAVISAPSKASEMSVLGGEADVSRGVC